MAELLGTGSTVPSADTRSSPAVTLSEPKSNTDMLLDLLGPTSSASSALYGSTGTSMSTMGACLPPYSSMSMSMSPAGSVGMGMGVAPLSGGLNSYGGGLSSLSLLPNVFPTTAVATLASQGMPTMTASPVAVSPSPSLPTAPMMPSAAIPTNFPPIIAYEKGGLRVKFEFTKQPGNPSLTAINIVHENTSPIPMNNFLFQAAVPKYIKLQMQPPSGSVLPPNCSGVVTQQLRLQNTLHGEKTLLMKVKIDYEYNGVPVSEQADIANFPSSL
mmetsp:Transcript_3329/g.5900  ORF Transcript_3329/g.5900 Transcript_3329/m.5900 type:complete len:272 (-) Transcript_3329:347-1162(-)